VHFSPEVRAIRNTQHFANGRVPLLCTFGLSEPAPRFYLADQVQTVGEIELAQIIVRNQPFLCLTYNSEAAEFARKHADLRRKIIASTESLVLMRVSVGAQRCLNRAILVSQSNFHIRTIWQLTRGAMAAAQRFARLPEIVGLHWFQYYDHPNGGREDGEDYNLGLVDITGRPYERLVETFSRINPRLADLHQRRPDTAVRNRPRPWRIPYAAMDAQDRSLLEEWPKEQALIASVTALNPKSLLGISTWRGVPIA
jgi:hypothetical protein